MTISMFALFFFSLVLSLFIVLGLGLAIGIYYKLNTKNLWVKELIKLDKVITKLETEKMLSPEIAV